MKSLTEITQSLNAIREALDADLVDMDIDCVKNKLLKLTQLMGLSAETKASAKKLLNMKEKMIFEMMDKKMPPSVQVRFLNSECFEENAILEYSDRLNAALTHSIDGLRSVMSLHKQEMASGIDKLQT